MSPLAPQVPEWAHTLPEFPGRQGLPAHATIERWLTDLIVRGELVPGDRLPRENDFADIVGVSRMTLRQALSTMESMGTVVRTTGRAGGTFVAEPRVDCDLSGLAGFTEQVRRANLRAGARVVSAVETPATDRIAAALGVRRNDPVFEIVRVRTAQRRPMALERSYFPAERLPGMLDQRLTGSLYELLTRKYKQTPHTARESLEPVIAREAEATLLDLAPGSPLMLIARTAYTSAGVAVEYARDLFRPDRVRITLQTGIGPSRLQPDLAMVVEGR